VRRALSVLGALALLTTPARAQRPGAHARLCEQIANTDEQTRSSGDTAASGRAPGRIVGQVVNRAGQPLVRARIELRRSLQDTVRWKLVATNAEGVFHLDSVPPGDYVLGAQALGYQRQWHALLMLGAGADTLCIRMRRNPQDLAPVVPVRKSPKGSR